MAGQDLQPSAKYSELSNTSLIVWSEKITCSNPQSCHRPHFYIFTFLSFVTYKPSKAKPWAATGGQRGWDWVSLDLWEGVFSVQGYASVIILSDFRHLKSWGCVASSKDADWELSQQHSLQSGSQVWLQHMSSILIAQLPRCPKAEYCLRRSFSCKNNLC